MYITDSTMNITDLIFFVDQPVEPMHLITFSYIHWKEICLPDGFRTTSMHGFYSGKQNLRPVQDCSTGHLINCNLKFSFLENGFGLLFFILLELRAKGYYLMSDTCPCVTPYFGVLYQTKLQ